VSRLRLPRRTAGPARLAITLLVASVALSACSGDDAPPPTQPSTQSPTAGTSGPITAVVSTCTGPSGSGKTQFSVAYRMDGVDDPIHLKDVSGFATYQGSKQVKAIPGPPTQEQTGPEDHLTFTGPEFDRLLLDRPTMRVDAQQTVHADSVEQLQGMRFRGPFGPARITQVRVNGDRVVMKISSSKRAAPGVQNLGPQEASLQVGSATLTQQGGGASGPQGSQNVNQMNFAGPLPSKGAASLTTSTWQILDLGTITIVLPASC
jgi:hypothetical protein